MRKDLFILLLVLYSILIPSFTSAKAPKIIGPGMVIENNDIILSSGITNVKELENTLKSGVKKEIIFTLELLRSWRFWPDEYIASKKITRIIKYDNLRKQYRISSGDSSKITEKVFMDLDDFKDRVFTVKDVNLANMKELEAGKYYIRVIVESRNMEQLPVVGFFMNFIPEVDMSLVKESEPFIVRGSR